MKIAIKPNAPEDYEAVEKILLAAFHTQAESKVMNTLDKVVGHSLFSFVATHPTHPAEVIWPWEGKYLRSFLVCG